MIPEAETVGYRNACKLYPLTPFHVRYVLFPPPQETLYSAVTDPREQLLCLYRSFLLRLRMFLRALSFPLLLSQNNISKRRFSSLHNVFHFLPW